MKRIKLHNKEFEISITFDEIQNAVKKIANKISEDYKGEIPVFLSILNGSFIFAADLLREINIDCVVSFIKLASYKGSSTSGKVLELIGINEDLTGRKIIVIEDIIDTGSTMAHLMDELKNHNPADIKIASLFFKPEVCKEKIHIDYLGMNLPNHFVVGYGLDYEGLGRNYYDIYKKID